jgi:hypothetical protein
MRGMRRGPGILLCTALLLLGLPSWGQGTLVVRLVLSGEQIAAAKGESDPTKVLPFRLAATADNRLVFSDHGVRENILIFEVYSITPQQIVKITDTAALRATVDELNGDEPAPSVMSVQALDLDAEGHLVILTDGPDPELAYLFHVDRRTGKIDVVSGLDRPFLPGAPISSIEGNSSMAVLGTTAYILLSDRFGAFFGDSIVAIDVHSATDGKGVATEVISTAQLEAVIGQGQDIDLNDIAVRPTRGTLVVINSGRAQATDDLLEVDPVQKTVSLLVAATDIEADLGIPDVGFSGIDVGPNDVIYLMNTFGTPGHPATRGIIAIANAKDGQGDATLFASQAEILASPEIRSVTGSPVAELRLQNAGLAVHPVTGEVFFTESDSRSPRTQTNGIIGVRRVTGTEPPPPGYGAGVSRR